MLHRLRAAACLALIAAAPAAAEETVMSRPIQAGSLHEGPLDMVAYWLPDGDGKLVVTATFAPREAADAVPMRIVLPLSDGDAAAFAMPGHAEAVYRFRRAGAAVTVSVDAAPAREGMAGS
ncbi:hypothetical protein [Amaricoccus sp.]|uniref:hypothetical protein n=1 Tax=Amaricoccus sp. TaxID=1872485 RepID=UPI001B4AB61A|nr:hypothetical protein [Amaricoccus sp.]MBP7240667.1 hypothetical protein [Amaricoccus sp.]